MYLGLGHTDYVKRSKVKATAGGGITVNGSLLSSSTFNFSDLVIVCRII